MEETNANPEAFEAKLGKAREILDSLSAPDLPLDKGMQLYKEGMALLNDATTMLEKAKLEFEEISSGEARSAQAD